MKKKWLLLCCVLAALLLAWCIRTLYIVRRAPERAFVTDSPQTTRRVPSATPTPTLSPEEQLIRQADEDFMAGRVNILLLGFDQSPERDDEDEAVYRSKKNDYRSDVLMLLAVDFEENRVHLISVPRDTYTPIYNTRGRWKVNAAFAKGGAATGDGFHYAQKTLEMLFGVPIPYYVGVNMNGLKALVDAIGGVDYDVDVEIRLNGRTLSTGFQHLSGQQVLDYCRARKGISTDLGRNDRQQRMLFTIFEQMQSSGSLASVPKIYAAVKDELYTNLTLSQVAALAAFGLELPAENLRRTTLEGAYVSNVYNASYYVLENKKLIALVKEEFGIDIQRENKYDLARVKRDKAAAEAKKAAESTPALEALEALEADATGEYKDSLQESVRIAALQLKDAVDSGAAESEILALRHRLNVAVANFLSVHADGGDVPASFRRLVP